MGLVNGSSACVQSHSCSMRLPLRTSVPSDTSRASASPARILYSPSRCARQPSPYNRLSISAPACGGPEVERSPMRPGPEGSPLSPERSRPRSPNTRNGARPTPSTRCSDPVAPRHAVGGSSARIPDTPGLATGHDAWVHVQPQSSPDPADHSSTSSPIRRPNSARDHSLPSTPKRSPKRSLDSSMRSSTRSRSSNQARSSSPKSPSSTSDREKSPYRSPNPPQSLTISNPNYEPQLSMSLSPKSLQSFTFPEPNPKPSAALKSKPPPQCRLRSNQPDRQANRNPIINPPPTLSPERGHAKHSPTVQPAPTLRPDASPDPWGGVLLSETLAHPLQPAHPLDPTSSHMQHHSSDPVPPRSSTGAIATILSHQAIASSARQEPVTTTSSTQPRSSGTTAGLPADVPKSPKRRITRVPKSPGRDPRSPSRGTNSPSRATRSPSHETSSASSTPGSPSRNPNSPSRGHSSPRRHLTLNPPSPHRSPNRTGKGPAPSPDRGPKPFPGPGQPWYPGSGCQKPDCHANHSPVVLPPPTLSPVATSQGSEDPLATPLPPQHPARSENPLHDPTSSRSPPSEPAHVSPAMPDAPAAPNLSATHSLSQQPACPSSTESKHSGSSSGPSPCLPSTAKPPARRGPQEAPSVQPAPLLAATHGVPPARQCVADVYSPRADSGQTHSADAHLAQMHSALEHSGPEYSDPAHDAARPDWGAVEAVENEVVRIGTVIQRLLAAGQLQGNVVSAPDQTHSGLPQVLRLLHAGHSLGAPLMHRGRFERSACVAVLFARRPGRRTCGTT